MKYLIYTLLLLFSVNLNGQGLNEEIGFIYTKAKYLIETNRIEDAVKELNKVIVKDSDYEDAMLLRAESKYALGAYTGVKKDLASYMQSNGITARVARLYGLTDAQGGNKKAALNSLNMALHSIKDDKQLYEIRAQILEENGKLMKACDDYSSAAELGSSKSEKKVSQLCGGVSSNKPTKNNRKTKPTKNNKKSRVILKKPKMGETDADEKDKVDDPIIDNEEKAEELEEEMNEELEEEAEKEYVDDTPREIVVDEDLTLILMGEGLGTRKITNQPNILIISDESGEVAIDVCVSKGGRVATAVFDNTNSTIRKQSLVSLAVRKAKDFWFEKGNKEEQCGKIIFRIQGS